MSTKTEIRHSVYRRNIDAALYAILIEVPFPEFRTKLLPLPAESRFSSATVDDYLMQLKHLGKIQVVIESGGPKVRISDDALREHTVARAPIGKDRLTELGLIHTT